MVEGPLPLDARVEVEPAGSGTRFTFTGTGEAGGAMRLAGPLVTRTLKRQFARHCENLKQVMESGASA